MHENILRDSLVTKIFISYTEGSKKQVMRLKLRFMDDKQAYFSAVTPENYEKPNKKLRQKPKFTLLTEFTEQMLQSMTHQLLTVKYSLK